MRTATTQSLTDGELFSIIEHGIRLTGMPGWGNGTPEGERDSWGLVHFVRHLPKLTPEEIERMETLNPKTPTQWKEEEEARRFLQGDLVMVHEMDARGATQRRAQGGGTGAAPDVQHVGPGGERRNFPEERGQRPGCQPRVVRCQGQRTAEIGGRRRVIQHVGAYALQSTRKLIDL